MKYTTNCKINNKINRYSIMLKISPSPKVIFETKNAKKISKGQRMYIRINVIAGLIFSLYFLNNLSITIPIKIKN